MYNQAHILTLVKKLMMKVLNLKLVILLKHQNITVELAKGWTYVINDFNQETLLKLMLELFTKKYCKKQIKKSLKLKKVIKKKCNKLYVKWKGYNNSFNSWIDKKDIKMWQV